MSMALASRRIALDLPTGLPTLGLLAHCPVVKCNLLKYSEDLTNAAWTKTTGAGTGTIPVVTAGSTDPLGGATAFRVQFDRGAGTGSTDTSILSQAASGFANPHSQFAAVWMKSNTGSTYTVRFDDNTSQANSTVDTTWRQFSVSTASVAATTFTLRILLRGDLGTSQTADILVWHPQVNEGTALLGYEATSDNQRVINLIPGYNAIKYSEQLDNAAWTKNRATVSANAVANPLDGAVTADKLIEDSTASNTHYLGGAHPIATGGSAVISVYAKAAERSWLVLSFNIGGASRVSFDLTNGVVGTVAGSYSGSIASLGNGWYRCVATKSVLSGSEGTAHIALASADSTPTYSGDGTSGVYLWGAMLNEGATALPYERSMDIPATKDPQYGWAYHLQLGSSSASDTNDPVYLTNLLDPDAVDDYVMIPLHLVDRDEWTIIAAVKTVTTSPVSQYACGVRYDGSAAKYVAARWSASTGPWANIYSLSSPVATTVLASAAAATWYLVALTFNRISGTLTERVVQSGALSSAIVTGVAGLSTPDVARLLNAAHATSAPMDGGGAYALIYSRALSDAEVMRAYKYMQQAKRETVTL